MARNSRQPIPPPDALLCRRCGYDLAGLTREMDCPECGKAVGASLPPVPCRGSLYSYGPDARLFQNWWRFAIDPVKSWDRIVFQKRVLIDHKFTTVVFVSLVPGIVTAAIASRSPLEFLFALFTSLVLFYPCVIVLAALIKIEELGIRFFASRRGWRISKNIASVITEFACFTWVLSAISVGAVWGFFLRGSVHQATLFGPISTYLLAMFLAFLPGLLWFETLVWIGVRKLRYANIPGSERHLADHGREARATDPREDAPASPDG